MKMASKPRLATFNTKRSLLRIERILKIMEGRQMSAKQITAALFCDQSLTTEYLRHLRSEPRRVRICKYDVIEGCRVPLYELGTEPDAPMTRKSGAQKHAEMKADPVRYARYLERERKNRKAKRDAVPVEKRQRKRLCLHERLEPRILKILAECPGYTTPQLAEKMKVGERSTRTAVDKLKKSGQIQRAVNAHTKMYCYELPTKPVPPRVAPRPQSIFAALGLP